MFRGHYHEPIRSPFARLFHRENTPALKVALWNAFVDSGLIGINDHDCSVIPRILPASYLPTIVTSCRTITECLFKILSLPSREIRSILPETPVTEHLIRELGVLKHKPARLTGSLRFDMAIVGPPLPTNPPKLLEVNDIGFDGTGRSSFIQETLLKLLPFLRSRVFCLDTAMSEVQNMRRLGRSLARFQYETYNWEEEVILMRAKRAGLSMRLISPDAFDVPLDEECPLLTREAVRVKGGRVVVGKNAFQPDAFQLAYSFELKDFQEAPHLFRNLVRSDTPQYSPFLTGLIAPKSILSVLQDRALTSRLLGKQRARLLAASLIDASLLPACETEVRAHPRDHVLKQVDGMGGELVWIGKDIPSRLRRIPRDERRHWVVQKRVDLNTIDVDGFLSRRRRVVADLGAYIHYDWNGERLTHFAVGGFITRATNRGLKVNVSGGGLQVPVMFERDRSGNPQTPL